MTEKKTKPVAVKKKEKPPLLLTLGTAALLIGGGGAAYWYFSQGNFGAGNLPVGAVVIPQNALMAISVTTDQGQWQQVRQFGTTETQAIVDQNLAQLRDRVLTANGFNYQQDIQPWVGKEVTVAFLAPPAGAATPQQNLPASANPQSALVVLPIQNPLQAKELLEKPRSTTNKLVERVYKGVQIKETQGSTTGNYAATVLDGKFLVVTTNPQAIEQAIDTYQGAANLASTPGFTQAANQVQSAQPFAKVYINVPAAAGVAAAAQTPNQALAQQQSQGLTATATLTAEGVQFKSISWLKPDSEKKYEVKNSAKTMPSLLPSDTLMMASGGNLNQLWKDYTQGITANPRNFDPKDISEGIKSTTGMDLEKDFLNWMQGEYSLALIPAPKDSPPGLPLGLMLMVEATDRRAADSTLSRLDEVMGSKYKFKVDQTTVGNDPVVTWTSNGVTVTRGWLNGNTAFITLGAPIAKQVLPKPANSLADGDLFKQSTQSGLNPNNGHFFVDVDRAINSNPLPLIPLPVGSQPFVKAMRSIGVTAAIHDERSSRYDVTVLLRKAEAPKPLPSPASP
jgi:hypothetical protein